MPIATSEIYDIGGRKYIDIDNIRIKVPWRYNRVTGVVIEGITPIQDIKKGDLIKGYTVIKKIWDGSEFLVLKSINV
jgi:hypothetical protein